VLRTPKFMSEILSTLNQRFGLEQFRPGQLEVIERLLAGKSVLAIFPTGAGKSLCYQLPSLLLDGLTLVISPLIALMKDQLESLQKRGIPAARLDSSLSAEQSRRVYADLREGRLRLLFVAPERMGNERFLQALAGRPPALLAVDEAHCISEWGHNFRPDYMKLARLAKELQVGRVLALTATATPEVAQSVAQAFQIAPEDVVRCPSFRPNLHLQMRPGPERDREQRLLASLPAGPTIVYVTFQRTAEEVAARLRAAGRPAEAYHAGLDSERRNQVQDHFMRAKDGVVVATIAFGMGVDKSDIRGVIHYNLPKSIENYAQEIGRAGRDGQTSQCVLLAAPEDRIALENFTYGDTPTAESLQAMITEVLEAGPEFDVSVYDLSQRHDIRPLVVDTVLTYLELDGLILATQPFYAEYKLAWTRSEADVLTRFDSTRAIFLKRMLACGRASRKWTTLDIHRAAQTLGEPRERLIKALNHLEESGDLQLQVAGVRQGYRRLPNDQPLQEILARQVQRFEQREERDRFRLESLLALVSEPGCVQQALQRYFGEVLQQPCGTCSSCLGQPPMSLLPASTGEVDWSVIEQIQREGHDCLTHPRQIARFLCGLTSPATTRARLGRHRLFGILAEVPFPQVLERINAPVKTGI
jgi:ATP-dependent DNA helicase RecQ